VIKWPGVAAKGTTCDVPVVGTDHYPTLLDAVGLPLKPSQHVDGLSMKPLLEGGQGKSDRFLYWNFPRAHGSGTPGSWGLRFGKWKIVQRKGQKPELYDLSSDRGESTNLAAQRPELVLSLLKRQQEYLAYTRPSKKAKKKKD
jgi:arylsulfatase A-like enzyme